MSSFDGGDEGAGARAAVERAFQAHHAAVVKKLTAHLRDVQLAEDAVQDAFETAVETWPRDGAPDQPEGWIVVTARRKAIDRMRRARSLADRTARAAAQAAADEDGDWTGDGSAVADDHLRLIFTCCHPSLSVSTRVALTLRTVSGMSTREIASSLLVSESTLAQRLSRAKRKIREANIPYRIPDQGELPERLDAVLATVYLIFNEGYLASHGDRLTRGDLSDEALRLARLLSNLMPREPEVLGLLALMCLHHSRRDARTTQQGAYVPLDQQDTSRWDHELIRQGMSYLRRALHHRNPGPYQVQAAIAAAHASRTGHEGPDWQLICSLYDTLARLSPSPVVEVNRAVATGFAKGPAAGLEILDRYVSDPELENYQPLHAARAELLSRSDRPRHEALAAYDAALAMTHNRAEADELRRRRSTLLEGMKTVEARPCDPTDGREREDPS